MNGIVHELKGPADQQTQGIRPSAQTVSGISWALLQLAALIFLWQGVWSWKVYPFHDQSQLYLIPVKTCF